MGAKVSKAANKEIGWFAVKPDAANSNVPWFTPLFESNPIVFHWHGDMFDIPGTGNLSLLSSEVNTNQAFAFGKNVLGLQFHLEINQAGIDALVENCKSELHSHSDYIQNEMQLKMQGHRVIKCEYLLEKILSNFFQ